MSKEKIIDDIEVRINRHAPFPNFDIKELCATQIYEEVFLLAISQDREKVLEEVKKYNELIMAVVNKYPDESRHETALRYIKQAEQSNNKISQKSKTNHS